MTDDVLKCPYPRSIFISIDEDVDEVSVVNRLIKKIEVLHHEFYFPLEEIIYLSKCIGVVFTTPKSVTQEFQWIG